MSRLGRPQWWLPLALLLLAGLGMQLLMQPACVELTERERTAYGARPQWQAGFDALSATCGVGLLTYELEGQYTPLGRWVLACLGVCGAALYLVAGRQVIGLLWAERAASLPSVAMILGAFFALHVAVMVTVGTLVLIWGAGWGADLERASWNAVASLSSLGWLRGSTLGGHAWLCVVVAFVGAVGWPIWLLLVARVRRHAPAKLLLVWAGTYVVFLLLSAGLMSALETPRAGPRSVQADDRLAAQPIGPRFARSLVQVTCASAAGQPAEQLGERRVSEGTKLVLAGVVLVGSLGGSAGGGIKWPLLLIVIAIRAGFFIRGSRRASDDIARRCRSAAVTCVDLLLVLTIVTALGLLLIETCTASSFQTPPTLADALLDAASAVAGANLSSGLVATVTSANLSSGIRQHVDLYQYGMTWLMVAMFIGRILPVLVLARAACGNDRDAPDRLPPML